MEERLPDQATDTRSNNQNDGALEDDIGGDDLYQSPTEEEVHEDMWISEEEAHWARQLKLAAEAPGSGMRPLSDLDYVNYAMVCRGNVSDALDRIKGMQTLRETYSIEDTVEEGVSALQQLLQIQPGFLVELDVSQDSGTSFEVWICNKYDPAKVKTSRANWKTHLVANYYSMLLKQPTIRSIREGGYLLIDCHDMSWANFDVDLESQFQFEFFRHAPIRYKHILAYNTYTFSHLAFSLAKPFLREEHKDVIKVGCKCDWDTHPSDNHATLGDMYLQPSYEVAMQRMIEKATLLLSQRFRNSREFTLP
jgi:hypothetical protein